MLTGQAKTDYQREYMRRYRAKNKDSAIIGQKETSQNASGLAVLDERTPVRPIALDPVDVRPEPLDPVRPGTRWAGPWAGPLTKERQVSRKGLANV